mmetsp:Transcript_59989/g.172190  ORF Transcript_59989/g.172190 Transcript_59989/m.172190 type:complete len:207 (-) Transcript_59989:1026-1646(-)
MPNRRWRINNTANGVRKHFCNCRPRGGVLDRARRLLRWSCTELRRRPTRICSIFPHPDEHAAVRPIGQHGWALANVHQLTLVERCALGVVSGAGSILDVLSPSSGRGQQHRAGQRQARLFLWRMRQSRQVSTRNHHQPRQNKDAQDNLEENCQAERVQNITASFAMNRLLVVRIDVAWAEQAFVLGQTGQRLLKACLGRIAGPAWA